MKVLIIYMEEEGGQIRLCRKTETCHKLILTPNTQTHPIHPYFYFIYKRGKIPSNFYLQHALTNVFPGSTLFLLSLDNVAWQISWAEGTMVDNSLMNRCVSPSEAPRCLIWL